MKVIINNDICVKCGMCVDMCPEALRWAGDFDRVECYAESDRLALVIDACPVEAISEDF